MNKKFKKRFTGLVAATLTAALVTGCVGGKKEEKKAEEEREVACNLK